jgi:HK97 family phage major capsid protein
MKDKLLKLLKAKEEARAALVGKSEKSEDVTELRGINAQIVAINTEIAELRSLIDEAEMADAGGTDEVDKRTKVVTDPNNQQPESRSYQPGRGFTPVQGGDGGTEERANQEFKDREKRGKELKEGRAVTVATSSIVLPKVASSTINGTFAQVSGLVDGVDRLVIAGGESFTQPYEKDTPAGDYADEGAAAATADTVFGYADIAKTKITAYSEITNEVKKLPAADYESVVMGGISKSARRKLAKEILVGTGATGHLTGILTTAAAAIDVATDLDVPAITNTTLKTIIYSYGGDEAVEESAVLILNKKDLLAFSQLRTTDGKDYHTIVTNGNTGTIDGIPFIINSAALAVSATGTAVGSYCMAYGALANYKLVIFSDLDVQRSTDYKFKEGMIAHRGEVYAGGNVVAHNGFIRVKKATAV